jgi:hypothetical protein
MTMMMDGSTATTTTSLQQVHDDWFQLHQRMLHSDRSKKQRSTRISPWNRTLTTSVTC